MLGMPERIKELGRVYPLGFEEVMAWEPWRVHSKTTREVACQKIFLIINPIGKICTFIRKQKFCTK